MTETAQHPIFQRPEISVRHRVNREDEKSGVLGDMHRIALARLENAGPMGYTWKELGELEGWHHGRVSSVLSDLHRVGQIARLAGKGSKRPGTRSSIYVHMSHVDGRETAAYGGSKASAALKELPEAQKRIAELESELFGLRNKSEDEAKDRIIDDLNSQVTKLQSELTQRPKPESWQAFLGEVNEAEQLLAGALNYPETDEVLANGRREIATGDHTITSISAEAVGCINDLRATLIRELSNSTELESRVANLTEALATEREASASARPVVPTMDADEAAFVDAVAKKVVNRPLDSTVPAKVRTLANLIVLAKRLQRS